MAIKMTYRHAVKVDVSQGVEKEFFPFGIAINEIMNTPVLWPLLLFFISVAAAAGTA